MSRTFGAVDKVAYRKTRKDIGKKRKKYRGESVIGHRYKYKRKTGNKTHLWLRAYQRVPMTKDGYKNWKPHLRNRLWKEITKMQPPIIVPLSYIDTQKKFEDFIAKTYWAGKFVIMGGSHAKNKGHFKPVAICTIIVTETVNGNVGRMIQKQRISKYKWFYKGNVRDLEFS